MRFTQPGIAGLTATEPFLYTAKCSPTTRQSLEMSLLKRCSQPVNGRLRYVLCIRRLLIFISPNNLSMSGTLYPLSVHTSGFV